MKQQLIIIFIGISGWCYGQPDFSEVPESTDSTYGYTDTNPIKLKKGNPERSIGYSYDFLSGLATPDNKGLRFVQRYSVENPKNDKGERQLNNRYSGKPMTGKGELLDKYVFVTHEKKDTLTIYVDIYRKGELRIPVGLKYR